MAEELRKIDRWNSEPLDVHTWSDHPEIKALCDQMYAEAGLSTLEPKGNRKPKRTVRESLRVLILDLYVKWLKDPSLSIGFRRFPHMNPRQKNSSLVSILLFLRNDAPYATFWIIGITISSWY